MSINEQITRIETNVKNSFTKCREKGATMPTDEISDNLPDCISSIPSVSKDTLEIIVDGAKEEIIKDVSEYKNIKIKPKTLDYFYVEALEDTTINFTQVGGLTTIPVLEYSIDNKVDENFNSYTIGQQINLTIGQKCYFRGDNNTFSESSLKYIKLTSTNNINVGGNIMSLFDKTCELKDLTSKNYVFNRLFNQLSKLQSITNLKLPATTLADYCYYGMFNGCTSLTSIPENLLPAIKLADGCYTYMFSGCSSLQSIPKGLLPATTLATNCYSTMFQNCGIQSIPKGLLPATTLEISCYSGMFSNCTSLQSIPDNLLPAMTLKENCYNGMFRNCTSLQSIPEGLLPATILAPSCYAIMFATCTSLQSIPENLFPATTLIDVCYFQMFYDCSSLKLSETKRDKYLIPFRIPTESTGTIASDSLDGMFVGTGGTFAGTPSINTTYYLWDYSE